MIGVDIITELEKLYYKLSYQISIEEYNPSITK